MNMFTKLGPGHCNISVGKTGDISHCFQFHTKSHSSFTLSEVQLWPLLVTHTLSHLKLQEQQRQQWPYRNTGCLFLICSHFHSFSQSSHGLWNVSNKGNQSVAQYTCMVCTYIVHLYGKQMKQLWRCKIDLNHPLNINVMHDGFKFTNVVHITNILQRQCTSSSSKVQNILSTYNSSLHTLTYFAIYQQNVSLQ